MNVKRNWMPGLAALFVVVCGSARAEFDPEASARAVAPFLDEQTVAIVRVDLSRIDVEGVWAKMVELGKADPQELAGPEEAMLQWVADFAVAGGTDLYLVVTLADGPVTPVFAVVPLGEGADADQLAGLLCDPPMPFGFHARLHGALVCAAPEAIERLRTAGPHPEPGLTKAFSAAGDGAAQLVIIPSSDMRRVVEEMMPTLPEEIGGGPSTALTRGVVWAAVGVNVFPRMSVRGVAQSEDEPAARALRGVIVHSLEALAAEADVRLRPALVSVVPSLTPGVRGNRLVLSLDEKELTDILETLFAPLLREVRESASRVACVQNVQAITMALHWHCQAHEGEWPEELEGLVDAGLLQNPRRPGSQVGYVYVKPPAPANKLERTNRVVVIYEAHDEWPEGGIVVGFADSHVEIVNEAEFRELVGERR